MTVDRYPVGAAEGGGWARLAKSVADQLLESGAGDDGGLGLLYVTDHIAEHVGSVLTFLKERTGVADWVGGVGVGVVAGDHEAFDTPAVAAMALPIERAHYRLLDSDAAPMWSAFPPPAMSYVSLIHADPEVDDLPARVAAVAAETQSYLIGGLTASRSDDAQIAGRVFSESVCGVVLDHTVRVTTGLTQSCSPLGPTRRITACERQVVFELDDAPALDALLADCGVDSADALRGRSSGLQVGFPVLGSDMGEYVVRNLVGADPRRGWLAIGDQPAVGDAMMFCMRDRKAAERDLERMLADVAARMPAPPRGALYVSCAARGPNMFDGESYELTRIRSALGAAPVVGFFANGEICNNRVYGFTGVLTVFH